MRVDGPLTRCQWCRCSYLEACPGGCGWVNDSHGAPLCSACVGVDHSWWKQARRLPNMRRAFFRGFMAATNDERAETQRNPYASSGDTCVWWQRGWEAGVRLEALEAVGG